MIESCVSASPDMNECKEGACQGVRESVCVSSACACATKMIHAASIAIMPEEGRAAVAGARERLPRLLSCPLVKSNM